MNNADLDERVAQHAEVAENERNEGKEKSGRKRTARFTRADAAHLNPSRWWFASSAFPMIAGTLGPVASAFSICALVRPWRQRLPNDAIITDAEYIDDPAWLLIVNAIQLAMALTSNVFLLLNMTRRVRFSVAQPITIVGWYISAICLTSLAATAGGPLGKADEEDATYIWSQAFYYGIWAAVLYALVSTLMVVTIYGAWKGHYEKDFNLTSSQRTLMLQTIMFLMYLLLGALVFSTTEGWSYLDAVYWADVTLFTVGFGDFSTDSPVGRALLFPYALVGVISLGLVIGSVRSLALERGQRKLDARFVEKKRREKLKKIAEEGGGRMLRPIHNAEKRAANLDDLNSKFLTEYERREQEFILMRQIQDEADRRRRWLALSTSLITWLVLWLLGAYIFLECESRYQNDWGYYDAFYFCFVSLTTIGYGDRTPISNAGRSFFVFWSLLALPTMTVLISNAGDTVIKFIRDSTLTLGSITILPGDRGIKADLKHALNKLSCGVLFKEKIKTTAPGYLGETNQTFDTDTESGIDPAASPMTRPDNREPSGFRPKAAAPEDNEEDPEPYDGGLRPPPTSHSQTSSSALPRVSADDPGGHLMQRRMTHRPAVLQRTSSNHVVPTRLPATREGYHCALIKEIARVTHHVKDHPRKKYSFAEWAWFLSLIGEDEGSSETHRAVHNDNASEKTHMTDTNQRRIKWSWVGKRSPLMGSVDEPEWVLERLTNKLAEELQGVKNEVEANADRLQRQHAAASERH